MKKKILIITSSGGGGLLQSAIAIANNEKKKNPDVKIIKRDVLEDWARFKIGRIFKNFYNWTQKRGKVNIQTFLVKCNLYANSILFPFIFFNTLFLLFKEKIDKVIDNQPISPAAVIKAIRIYNKICKKTIVLQKVFVDLPTPQYAQFMKSVKNLSKKDKKHINIITIKPLLEKNQREEHFWEKYCGLSKEKVIYRDYLIRDSFDLFRNLKKEDKDFKIFLKTYFLEETNLIKQCLEKGFFSFIEKKEGLEFNILKNDKLIVVLLGSKPASEATYEYVKNFIKICKNLKDRFYIFAFCGKFSSNKKKAFRKICDLVDNTKEFPKNLNIIPMSFQKDNIIASLFHRSDLTITRSGGQTIMELIAVAKSHKWIHSETKKKNKKLSKEILLKGIPFWEMGNAMYLQKKDNGDIVTPEILEDKIKNIF
ncbi:MAG: hypothetical protein AMS24_05335 [Chlamydiae bacterium SM23_39]|nr:MAG: hypothetical protein AMS24_05335 [Chlamydiae bacterium SM23_39]